MIPQLNFAFYEEYTQKRAYIFSHRYLDLVYNHVVSLVWGALGQGGDLWSLAADGLEGSLGQSVVNFTISMQGKHVFKNCIYQGTQSSPTLQNIIATFTRYNWRQTLMGNS